MEKKLKKSTDRIKMPDEVKNDIMEKCTAKAMKDKHPNQAETVFEVEHVGSRRIFRTIAGIAACAVLVGGIGVGTHLISRNGIPSDQGFSDAAEDATEPAEEDTEETTEGVSVNEAAYTKMPDTKAMNKDLAADILTQMGLQVKFEYVWSTDIMPEYVVRTEPEPAEVIEIGSEVTIFVSGTDGKNEGGVLDVDFDIPDTQKRFIYDRDPQSPLYPDNEKCEEIISVFRYSIYQEVSKEEVLSKVDKVSPEDQLGFGSYSIDWNSGDSWGELTAYDIGIVKYEIEYKDGDSRLEYYRIEPANFDTNIRKILGWKEGYCPFGTPYKLGLQYNGNDLAGTRLRAVSNAFYGWNWNNVYLVDSFRNEAPAYEFTAGPTIIKVYSDGTIEWTHPEGDESDSNIYRAEDVDGETPDSQCTPLCQLLEEALKY